jgi:hypothetical protein
MVRERETGEVAALQHPHYLYQPGQCPDRLAG